VDRDLKLLLQGVRVVLVVLVVFVTVAAIALGPRLLHHRELGYGHGSCTVTGNVGVCVMP
jgi:hypothetical protein